MCHPLYSSCVDIFWVLWRPLVCSKIKKYVWRYSRAWKIPQQGFSRKFYALRGLTCAMLHTADPSLTDENIHYFYVKKKKLQISLNPLRTPISSKLPLSQTPHAFSFSKGNLLQRYPKHTFCSAGQHWVLDRSDEPVLQKFGEGGGNLRVLKG